METTISETTELECSLILIKLSNLRFHAKQQSLLLDQLKDKIIIENYENLLYELFNKYQC